MFLRKQQRKSPLERQVARVLCEILDERMSTVMSSSITLGVYIIGKEMVTMPDTEDGGVWFKATSDFKWRASRLSCGKWEHVSKCDKIVEMAKDDQIVLWPKFTANVWNSDEIVRVTER